MEAMIPVRLVPVEVFGAESYGLSDAVQSWSDCNRAIGHIYRFDEDKSPREPGDTLTVWVDSDEYKAFAAKVFGEERP